MSKKTEEAQEDAEMNMTPMIDVVFLLIIFFLCIDFRILEAKLAAYLPKDKGSQPTEAPPQEQLSLKVVCEALGDKVTRLPNAKIRKTKGLTQNREIARAYKLDGHQVYWVLGPSEVRDPKELRKKLDEIYNNTDTWQTDNDTGKLKPMPIVIEPGVNAMYADVAGTVDIVRAAKFDEINFGGGMGSQAAGSELRGRHNVGGG